MVEGIHPIQKDIYLRMTPAEKLNLAFDLYRMARELKAAGLRWQNPTWSEEKIQHKVREIFLYAYT